MADFTRDEAIMNGPGNLGHEIADVLRSIRYDLRRRLGWEADPAYPEYDAYARRPRWALAGGVAALAVGGVAATYFALAGGLGGWLLGPDATGANPAAPPGTPTVTSAARAPGPVPRTTPPASDPPPGLPPIIVTNGRPAAGRMPMLPPPPKPSDRATSTATTSPGPTATAPPRSPAPSSPSSPSPTDNPTSDNPDPAPSPAPIDSDAAAGDASSPADASAARPVEMRFVSTFASTDA